MTILPEYWRGWKNPERGRELEKNLIRLTGNGRANAWKK